MAASIKDFQKISIVTPSFNQGQFIENTILSVLEQNYPNLEYIIIDGGSADNSVEVIRKYEKYLSYWVSEKDRGQYHAINKGFEKSHGEIMAWLNSDDMYCKWAFKAVADIFSQNPGIEWMTSLFPLVWASGGEAAACFARPGYNAKAFYEGRYTDIIPDKSLQYIQQESTFWKRSLWTRCGGAVSEKYELAGDFDLWARFFESAVLCGVSVPLAGFRIHDTQRSKNIGQYRQECLSVLERYNAVKFRSRIKVSEKLSLISHLPLFRRFMMTRVGYEIHTVHATLEGNETRWHVTESTKIL
jgi:glycosyltransferase involved in cell wall biosynthesis